MQDDAEAFAPVRELGEEITEEASRARRDSQRTTATARRMRQQTTTALERALMAKRRELAAQSGRSSCTSRRPRSRSGWATPTGRPTPASTPSEPGISTSAPSRSRRRRKPVLRRMAATVLADWRRATQDQRIDRMPADLRNQLASTAERVAVTFELAARVRERIADRNGPEADHYRLRAAWNRTVADFERHQAALREGHLLAVPWRPATRPSTRRS